VKDMAFWNLQPKEKSVIAKPFSQLLMLYLQTFSDRLLTRCYPNVCFLPPSFTLSAAQTQILNSDFHIVCLHVIWGKCMRKMYVLLLVRQGCVVEFSLFLVQNASRVDDWLLNEVKRAVSSQCS
jgi:hypothetical protein